MWAFHPKPACIGWLFFLINGWRVAYFFPESDHIGDRKIKGAGFLTYKSIFQPIVLPKTHIKHYILDKPYMTSNNPKT